MNGKRIRKSVELRDWIRAIKRIEKWQETPQESIRLPTMRESIESYLGDCLPRNLKASTVGSYEKTFEHLEAFCRSRGVIHVDQIDLSLLTDFFVLAKSEEGTPRPIKPSTSSKELETLRAFCAFAKKRGWIQENHAKELDPPREEGPPTLSFEHDEVEKILEACGKLEDDNPNTGNARGRGKRSAVDLESGKPLRPHHEDRARRCTSAWVHRRLRRCARS